MQTFRPDEHRDEFKVLGGSPRSQTAVMTLAAGDSTGGPDNRHEASDQWLYVLSGSGRAVVEGRELTLTAGMLLLIEAGEAHELAAGEGGPLATFSIYAPPAYGERA